MKDDEPPEDVGESQLWGRIRKLEKHVYPDRRDVLKAGVGAAVGGAAVFGSTGNAAAGSQSAGTWGTQAKPQDGYLEDLYDHNGNQPLSLPGDGSVSVDDLVGGYASKLRVFSSNGVSTTVDPANTTTPLQDAHDAASVGDAIVLPPGKITESATFNWTTANLRLLGWGSSRVEFTDLANAGVSYDAFRTHVDGVIFDGSDPVNRTAPVWQFAGTANHQECNFGTVRFQNGGNPVIDMTTYSPFSSTWGMVNFQSGSNSNQGRNIAGKFGVGCEVGALYLGAQSGPWTGLDISGSVTIGNINVGGDINTALDHSGAATEASLVVGQMNYETGNTFAGAAVRLGGSPTAIIGSVDVRSGSPDYAVELYDPGTDPPKRKIIMSTTGNRSLAFVNLASGMPADSAFSSYYFGPAKNVADNSGTTNGTFRTLASAGTANG